MYLAQEGATSGPRATSGQRGPIFVALRQPLWPKCGPRDTKKGSMWPAVKNSCPPLIQPVYIEIFPKQTRYFFQSSICKFATTTCHSKKNCGNEFIIDYLIKSVAIVVGHCVVQHFLFNIEVLLDHIKQSTELIQPKFN